MTQRGTRSGSHREWATGWAGCSAVFLAAALATGSGAGEAQPQPAPAAQAKCAQPKYLCLPARLGADETMTSRTFQFADFNGDGLPDLLQMSYGPDRAWVIPNQGRPGRPLLGAPLRFPCNFSELRNNSLNDADAWAVDYDGDGDVDLAVTTTGPGQVVLIVNEGDKGMPALADGKVLVDKPAPGGTLTAADADGDGRPDLYVQPATGGLRLHRNSSGAQGISAAPAEDVKDTAGAPVAAFCPAPGDFNADGVLDLVSLGKAGGALIHLGVKETKGLVFQPALPALDEAGKPIAGGTDVALFDWNGDGKLDLLILDESCAIRCHAGTEKGKAVFRGQAERVHGNAFGRADENYAPALVDMDGDGRSDLLLGGSYDLRCGGANPMLRVYRNTLLTGPRAFGRGAFVLGPKSEPLQLSPMGYQESGEPSLTDFNGDGRLDLLWAPSFAAAHLYAGDEAAPGAYKGAALKLAAAMLNGKPLRLRPQAADWNGDGATDLVGYTSSDNYNGYVLFLNQGTSQAPKFGDAVPMSADGKELKGGHTGIGFPCVWDWDGDGRPDLVASGYEDPFRYSHPALRWYRNKDGSAQVEPAVDLKIGPQGAKIPFMGRPSAGDLDGDGVSDLVLGRQGYRNHNFLSYSEVWWLRGVPADAPDPVRDLSVASCADRAVTLAWTAPAGAASCEVRCALQPIDEASWFTARPAARAPASASSGTQQFEFDGLEPGALYYFALCPVGSKGGRSAVSNNVRAATRPLVIVSLAQGAPAPALGVSSYTGCSDATTPQKFAPAGIMYIRGGEEQWGACQSYLKFDLSPLAGRTVRGVWLTLAAVASSSTDWNVRCREVRSAWDEKTVTSTKRDGTAPWSEADYGASLPEISPHELYGLKRWDATELALRRLKAGEPLLSLHLSTFMHREAQGFADSESKNAALRPTLTVVLEEEGKP